MATLFVRHEVEDFDKWLSAYNEFEGERSSLGVMDAGVFQSDANSNEVTVYHDFESMEAARSFAGSPRLMEVMKNAGVVGVPNIWFATRI